MLAAPVQTNVPVPEEVIIDQEMLRESAESYLRGVIFEITEKLGPALDPHAPFAELGIDSFYVLKIIRRLEADFGTLPKSLLFEHFTIQDLANYFVRKHPQTLAAMFALKLQVAASRGKGPGGQANNGVAAPRKTGAAVVGNPTPGQTEPIRILEREAFREPELKRVLQALFDQYKVEGCVSRGTRKIAPNLFIGSQRRGYFNYARFRNIILVYAFTGPRDYFPALLQEIYRYCEAKGFQLNVLTDEELPPVGGITFSATPFGVLQPVVNLGSFSLEGGAMRRLRYQVSKFEKAGRCRTEEYRPGCNQETDRDIARVIDQWCAGKTMVNPLVGEVREEILRGTLPGEHRLFLTYLDDTLYTVVLITAICSRVNGYLMDLEFYPAEMPVGGLEYAIVEIIKILVREGCDVLSLGGTYGCKLAASAFADPEIDRILDDLRRQNIFNDSGNLQFKNKFRPENRSIYLCRPVGSGDPENVVDIIMMIADPERAQTSDAENYNFPGSRREPTVTLVGDAEGNESSATRAPVDAPPMSWQGSEWARALSNCGFNPLNLPFEDVAFDLKTDSWAQLEMAEIDEQMKQVYLQIQRSEDVNSHLRQIFPFPHFVLTDSGSTAEHIFFKAWAKKGLVLQNLLFPSTIFHERDQGFTAMEVPDPAVFDLRADAPYKGNVDLPAVQQHLADDAGAIAFVCIELGNNAAGGSPVSMRQLKDLKALLAPYSIPLVMDITRVMENAQFLTERDEAYAGKSTAAVAREIVSCADAVIGSLTKDFCITKGGMIATGDVNLFRRCQEIADVEGAGIDLIDKKLIGAAMRNEKQIETRTRHRMETVRRIWKALKEHGVPVAEPVGGHCVLIDVKQMPEFENFEHPVASFLAWLYLNTGIRGSAHSVGLKKDTSIHGLVRLAIPAGLKADKVDAIIHSLITAFEQRVNIPELVAVSGGQVPLGGLFAKYEVRTYDRRAEKAGAQAESAAVIGKENMANAAAPSISMTPPSQEVAQCSSVQDKAPMEPVIRGDRPPKTIDQRRQSPRDDIAIVGMAGRYPKAKNVAELWRNLIEAKDCIGEIPADRYQQRQRHGYSPRYRGGFIDDIDKFDSLFFNISPREAEMLDPQERLFLEVAWEAIEDAGYNPEALTQEDGSRNIGVFVGAVWSLYQMLGVEEKHSGNKIVPNSFLWSIANRVSYWFNFSGPSVSVDTACSSSLTAIHLACEAIYSGDCSAAIVGGVNLDLHQAKTDINQAGGALSPDGVCRSFGKGANGYVQGEGVGALVLKQLGQALDDRDNIYGVIKSAAVNHGGRTSGYSVPNPKAQSNLIALALKKARIESGSIGYIEAHGTGTELGDPIEIAGLTDVFNSHHVPGQSCPIGSIKSNIGHLEAAAGIVGITKVLLQMKHRQLVPSLHASELNEFIDFQNSPFYVVQRPEEWKPKEVDGRLLPLRAGISSFGAGGANAHVILESYQPEQDAAEQTDTASPLIFPLSARSEEQLRAIAIRLKAFLEENATQPGDVAFTLQAGRKSFDYRVAIVAVNTEGLLAGLTSFLAGRKHEDIVPGHSKSGGAFTSLLNQREREEFVRLVLQGHDIRRIARLWAEGVIADWSQLLPQSSAKRISLPTYPFADRRHWAQSGSPRRDKLQSVAALHPLLDSNESTFERQIFRKTFHDRDFFIHDHVVANVPTLPGVAYLELARKAGEIAAGRKVRRIRNVVWVTPISVQNSVPRDVLIELRPNGAAVRFEVFSHDEKGDKLLHAQGILEYATREEDACGSEYVDLEAVRARCARVMDGKDAYALFSSLGLNLGPSFQVLGEVYKNEEEVVGTLRLPDFRHSELQSMILHPSLVDGSFQAGMSAQLGAVKEMFVPFSIAEIEILDSLAGNCFSYVTAVKDDKKGKREDARVAKSNVWILDATGKVLVKIRESSGVPLRDLYKKPAATAEDGFTNLYYAYEWERTPLRAPIREEVPESIVLFDTEAILHEGYCRHLRNAGLNGDRVILVRPGERFVDRGKQSYAINPGSVADFVRLIKSLIEKKYPLKNICFAWGAGSADFRNTDALKQSMERGVYAFFSLCQAVIECGLVNDVQLIYLHSPGRGETQPQNEAVTGLVKALRLEHSKLLCKVLEVRRESGSQQEIVDALLTELQPQSNDASAVRYDAQERYTPKLKAFALEKPTASSPGQAAPRKEGVYLITGGAGGLGLIFAEFLAKEFNARLVLAGRSELSSTLETKLDELRRFGAQVLYRRTDTANEEDVLTLVKETKSRFGVINGVIHAAGVLQDSLAQNKSRDEMTAVFAPKVFGILHLDEATKNEPLDFFVAFSSLAALTGNVGQSDYSYANYFMDCVVRDRERLRAEGARSGKSLSINWSLWAQGGMKVDEQIEVFLRKTSGIRPLSVETGIETFLGGLAGERFQFAAMEGVQDKVELSWGLRKKKAAADRLLTPSSSSAPGGTPAIAGNKTEELEAALRRELTRVAGELLKIAEEDIASDKVLLDLGFDSIGLTTFANAINDRYQLDITPVLFFEYPTIDGLIQYLCSERMEEIGRSYCQAESAMAARSGAAAVPDSQPLSDEPELDFAIRKGWNPTVLEQKAKPSRAALQPGNRFLDDPIAIVGMSGMMPESADLDEFWDNLKNSRDMVDLIPEDRWDWKDYYGDPFKEVNKSNSKWGGFMKEVDKFDAPFFGISPREAQMMDPQQRIFLETVWKAIEDSGHKVSDLSGTRTGLFVGAATNDYIDLLRHMEVPLDAYSASGNSHSVLANRVSYLLNLHGPSAPIDTACSSSLVALHRAVESIHSGSCDMAIAGGVQVMLSPSAYISFGMAGMLSSDGKCKTFDKRANGYVRGEGVAAVLLKRLSAAEVDGDHVYAIIKATAENHGGRVTTMVAPNAAAQSALLVEAYERAQIDPGTVGYIECHGTGTSLGDPIETQALGKAFAELYQRHDKGPSKTPHCALGAVKTNIGHLETAAGVASLVKVLLAMKHQQIPPNIHFEGLNPYINLQGTPFSIADKLTAWQRLSGEDGKPIPLRGGVSSFGFGGANAHVVLEEHMASRRIVSGREQTTSQLIVLSARNADRLQAYVHSLEAYLEKTDVPLANLAYTLQAGRDEMAERLALQVASTTELREKLREIGNGLTPAQCYRNHIKSGERKGKIPEASDEQSFIGSLIERKELSRLAELWVSGARIDWRRLHSPVVPARISLPTYPFARERYWITVPEKRKAITAAASSHDSALAEKVSQEEIKGEIQSWAPVWQETGDESSRGAQPTPVSSRLLVLRADQEQMAWIRKSYPAASLVQFGPTSSIEAIATALRESSFDQLLWFAPDVDRESGGKREANEALIARQEQGVVFVFRIIKALLQAGYLGRKLQWTLIISRAQQVAGGEVLQPTHAAVVGLVGSLAKEQPLWDLRLLDLESLAVASPGECLSLPYDKQGNPLANRRGRWFEQVLKPVTLAGDGQTRYRQNGVYVVIGGGGGIGEVWTQFMIEQYQAQVVWIGRRKRDQAIADKVRHMGRLGPAPLYIAADASDVAALGQARNEILKIYPAIHGVVHSAVVLRDEALARMDEADFRASLAAKVDVSVNIDRVFGDEKLDFMLFFSSIISFFKAAKQANYAAGCTFKDSFAQALQRERPYPVKIMNWGYWGGVGVVADEIHRATMAQLGLGSIEPQEGMTSLQVLMCCGIPQVALIKALHPDITSILTTGRGANSSASGRPARPARTIGKAEIHKIITGNLSRELKMESAKMRDDVPVMEFGLDSIIGVNLVRAINESLGIELPLKALFGPGTVADLVKLVGELVGTDSQSEAAVIGVVDRSQVDRLPLSFPQERVWLFEQLERGSARYNIFRAVILRGELNLDQVEQAFHQLVVRHESLRTVFHSRDGQAQQHILERVDFALERIDVTGKQSEAERHARAREICQGEALRPFDLGRGPLLRAKVIRLGEQEYILMFNMHHIVGDGWSLGILTREMGEILESLRQGRSPQLKPLPIQYVDYAVWQRRWLEESGALKRQLGYWQEKLAGVAESLDLATDYPRPSIRSLGGAHHDFRLDAGLTRELKGLAEGRGVTLFMLLLAIFKVLLYRYTGQRDICVGTMIANRQYRETENLIGMFANLLALRSQVEGGDKFTALLAQVKATCLEAYENQDAPFEKVVELLRPHRKVAHNPIFQVMVMLHNVDMGIEDRFPEYPLESALTELDLGVDLRDTAQGLTGVIEYSTALYKAKTIERMAQHFVGLCRAIVATPTARVCNLEYVGEKEKHQLLVQFNGNRVDYPRDKCIHALFAEQVALHPNKTAVVCGEQDFSYQELSDKSHDLALYLQSVGVQPDSLVGLCVERSLDMLVGLLGILRAGAAYVPLDPDYPADRLAYMVQDSQATVVLTQRKLQTKLTSLTTADTRIVALDRPEIGDCVARLKAEGVRLQQQVKPDHLAYVIYTSGSTGKPKGVMVEHANVLRLFRATDAWFRFDESDVWTLFHSFAFDFSVWEIWGALLYGGTLLVVPKDIARSPQEFYRLLCRHQVTVLNQTPSAFRQLIAAQAESEQAHHLRYVIFGGEALEVAALKPWYERNAPQTRLINMYGITETTVHVTYRPLESSDAEKRGPSLIGVSIPDLRTYILDTQLAPVPIGVAGEIYVSGAGVARGYLHRPELTQEKFVSNPFQPGTRMYKTGDLGRWLDDGTMQYLGRLDSQVKIRGFRIELGEIESQLNQHPDVEDCVAIAEGEAADQRLIAFYRAKDTTGEHLVRLSNDSLREWLSKTLPEHMVPAAYVSLTEIPLDANGKVDRRTLANMQVTIASGREYVAPRNATEQQLVEIWAQVLKLRPEKIGVEDNFFELGGHSLLATRLIGEIRSRLGIELPLKELFDRPSVAQFAMLVPKAGKSDIAPLLPVNRSRYERLPLSFAQERLWFIHQLEPDSAAYNLPLAGTMMGELDIDQVEQAFHLLIARHESLRTVFSSQEGQAEQRILDQLEWKLERVDLSHYRTREEVDRQAREICRSEAATPFDLVRGPLLRGKVIKLAEQEHLLMLNMHHIISDGWSLGILTRELGEILKVLRQGRNAELKPLPIQYVDYAVWQRRWLEESGTLKRQLAYWEQKLAGVTESLDLATDYPRPKVQSFAGATQAFALDGQLARQLKLLAEEQGCTLFMLLLAACKVMLYRYTGQNDICVGSPIANRQYRETEGLIGMFANTLALRSQVKGGDRFTGLLAEVKATCLEAYENQDAPFEKIVELPQLERNLAISPLFQVMVVMQGVNMGTPESKIHPYAVEMGVSKFDLTIGFMEGPKGLRGEIEYSTALYKAKTVERMAEHFVGLCRAIVGTPTARIQELEYVREEEKHQLLAEFNASRVDDAKDKCIHELFVDQVPVHSGKAAVVCGEEQLTYQELFERSRDLAMYLQSLGVKPEDRVGLCMERSLDMIVGLFGILLAGGAYVPLDPAYPEVRLAYMLRDSAARLVVTQERLEERLRTWVEPETPLLVLDRQRHEIETAVAGWKAKDVELQKEVRPHHLAYVIYTSGSTGEPKGVAIEHHSPVTLVRWASQVYSAEELTGVLASTSICFDLSVYEIFVTLANGGTVVLVTNALGLVGIAQKHKVTLVNTVPSAMEELVRLGAIPDTVQTINLAGEALSSKLVDAIYRNSTVKKVYDLYGPSEATTYSTWILRTRQGLQSIGRPIANTQVYILDEQQRVQPIGVPGELYIAGDGLARGYLNKPELTREKFVANRFAPGTRMYRTGDRARWLEDGNLQYLGRIDTQVKIRGYRIELGEIEAQLNQHPEIEDSVVVARGEASNQQLIGFYRAKGTQADHIVELGQAALQGHLSRRLPDYMVPAALVSLAAIPLNANGKVDRRALARLEVKAGSAEEYVAPRNQGEKQLVEIWADVLNLATEKVGVYDNFFALGGHSLLATQLISRIRRQLDVDLPLKALFERPRIAQMAELVTQSRRSDVACIRPVERRGLGPLPLSFAQERAWFLNQLQPDSAVYNLPVVLSIDGEVKIADLEQAFRVIIERHEALRTVFPGRDGQAEQRIFEGLDFALERIDVSGYGSASEQQAKAREICQSEALRPFDLSRGPLLRGRVIQLADQQQILMLSMHHIISDGWSLGVLARELGEILEALRQGRRPQLKPLPIQYVDYAVWQRRWLEESGTLKRQLTYWQEKLAGVAESLDLATDYPRPKVQSFAGDGHSFTLDAELTTRLKRMADHRGCTLFMVLLAVFKALLHRYTGQSDVCVGSPIANRQYQETEGLIGMFVNTLALRSHVEGEDRFTALLAQVKATCLEAYEHQDAPFEKIVELLQPERNLAISPIFQVMLMLESGENAERGRSPAFRALPTGVSKFDLTFSFQQSREGLSGWIEYSTALYKRESIARMGEHFVGLCRAIVARPAARIQELEYVDEQEKQRVLVEFNDTQVDYPRDQCIHDFFLAQVEQNPEARAVVLGERELSYRQLWERSRDLAMQLQALGVKPDSVVGLYVERSLEMLVGILGTVQAGGAYLPLDPGHPDERVAYMLEDSEAGIVLTQDKYKSKIRSLMVEEARIVSLDGEWGELSRSAAGMRKAGQQLRREVTPQHAAYVIYTSGSTGKPKGVVVEHRALVNRIHWMQKRYGLEAGEVVLQKTPYSFDVSLWEFFWPLMAGATVVLAVPEGHKDVAYLEEVIEQRQVTTLHFVPSMLHTFLQHGRGQLRSVKRIFSSGEALDRRSVDEYRKRFPEAALHNLYGPTEAAIDVTAYDCTELEHGFVPIGSPIANTQIYILDEQRQAQPIGVAGELYIAGEGLARGYLNRPELTREKFVANPYVPGTRMYRTGDQARWLENGDIQYLGRMDTQVKIRGFRIELGEIEARLNQHPQIEDSVVMARGQGTDKRLVAFYRRKCGASKVVGNEELREHLLRHLPEYMIPTAFAELTAIPLSANGKVDRLALARMEVKIGPAEEHAAPRNQGEKQLVEIWAEVLNLPPEKVGIHDNFFEMGGHSLVAVQLMAKINHRFRQLLPLGVIFAAPNISAMAQLIANREASSSNIVVPIRTQGNGLPIFGVPGVGGNVLSLQPLVRALGADQPFYGLQAVGLDGNTPPFHRVEDTARANIDALKTVQPVGPYELLGHSYGGVVAYEMARMLLAEGEEVSRLILLDSVAPSLMRLPAPKDDVTELLEACATAAKVYDIKLEIDFHRMKGLSTEAALKYVVGLLQESGVDMNDAQLAAFYRVYRANLNCYRTFKPSMLPRDIDVVLYVATQADGAATPLHRGWNELVLSPVQIYTVDADHFSLLSEVQFANLADAFAV